MSEGGRGRALEIELADVGGDRIAGAGLGSQRGAEGREDDFEEDFDADDEDGVVANKPVLRHRRPLYIRNALQWIPEPIKSSLKPPQTCRDWLGFILLKVPILQWVWTYKINYLVGDIIAGITVAIMHIPQGLAYALLANVDSVYGLYASFVPVIVYSIFGSSKHISIGTFAVVELMIGNSVDKVFTSMGLENCSITAEGNETVVQVVMFQGDLTSCDEIKTSIVVTIALLSGIVMFTMGLFQLGFITIFMSEPLISGYTTGAAVHVFTSQLQHITGLGPLIKVSAGLFKIPRTWIAMFSNFLSINPAAIIISVIAMIFLIIFKILNKLLKSPKVKVPVKVYRRQESKWVVKKFPWPIPIPSQLIVVIVATIISYFAMLKDRYNVEPIGYIPNGLPNITVPNVGLMPALIQDSFVIGIVTFSVTVSLAKVFAREFGYKVDSNQEFLALGLINMVGCFFSSFTAAGSLSRSTIQASAGGKTQLVGLISSAIILVVLLRIGSLFEQLPKAILAAIIWVALYGMFKQFKDLYKYFKLSAWDGMVWVVVFLATVLCGVDLGLGIGVGFSLLVIVLRIILPTSAILSEDHDGEEVFRNMDNFEKVDTVPGILIFRFQAPICFINCRVFRLRLELACGFQDKAGLKQNRNTEGCLQTLCYKTRLTHRGSYNTNESGASFSARNNTVAITLNSGNSSSKDSDINHLTVPERVHTVIIDSSPIGFMDAVGVKTLQEIVVDFDKLGVQVLFVCMTKENRDLMGRSGFFRRCSKKWLFPSIQDAMRHAQYEPVLHPATSSQMAQSQGTPGQSQPSMREEEEVVPTNVSRASSDLSIDDVPGSPSEQESIGLVKSFDSIRGASGNLRKSGSLRPSMATLASLGKPSPPPPVQDNSKSKEA